MHQVLYLSCGLGSSSDPQQLGTNVRWLLILTLCVSRQTLPSFLTAWGTLEMLRSSMSSCHRLGSWPSSTGSSRIPGLLSAKEQARSAANIFFKIIYLSSEWLSHILLVLFNWKWSTLNEVKIFSSERTSQYFNPFKHWGEHQNGFDFTWTGKALWGCADYTQTEERTPAGSHLGPELLVKISEKQETQWDTL